MVLEFVGEKRVCNANAISKRDGLPLFIDRKDAKQKLNDSLSKFLFIRFLTRPQENANLSLEITRHCTDIIAVADVSTRLEMRFAHLGFVREFFLVYVRQRLYVQSLNGYSPAACSRGWFYGRESTRATQQKVYALSRVVRFAVFFLKINIPATNEREPPMVPMYLGSKNDLTLVARETRSSLLAKRPGCNFPSWYLPFANGARVLFIDIVSRFSRQEGNLLFDSRVLSDSRFCLDVRARILNVPLVRSKSFQVVSPKETLLRKKLRSRTNAQTRTIFSFERVDRCSNKRLC